jgi:predicted translin family RNA/ssDNA-binding protein
MLNNLSDLAEDPESVLSNVRRKLDTFDAGRLEKMLADYGSAKTRRFFRQLKSGDHA